MTTVSNNYSTYSTTNDYDMPNAQRATSRNGKSTKRKNQKRGNKSHRTNDKQHGKTRQNTAKPTNNEGANSVNGTQTTEKTVRQQPLSELDGGFIDAGAGKVNFRINDPSRGRLLIGISNTSMQIYVPASRQEGNVGAVPTIADGETITLDFANAENWTEQEMEYLNSVSGAFADYNQADKTASDAALGQTVKARLEALRDPGFWNHVSEAQSKKEEKLVTLADGREVIVKNEFELKPERRNSSGTVLYSVFNPGDGKTTHRVRITEDGLRATLGKKKGDTNPIRIAEDGSVKIVMNMTEFSETKSKEDTIAKTMESYIASAPLRSLPLAKVGGETNVHLLESKQDDKIAIHFDREQEAIEQVEIGADSIKFTTLVPQGVLDGVSAEVSELGFVKFEKIIDFADIANLSTTDKASFDMLKEALSDINPQNLTPEQESLLNKIDARIEALENPYFWGTVDSEVQGLINNTLNGEPVEIKTEYKLIQRTPIDKTGQSTVEFYVNRGNGNEKLELLDDNKVKVGTEPFDVRQDEETGDWYMVTGFNTVDTLMRQRISSNMKQATAKAEPSDRIPLISSISNNTNAHRVIADQPAKSTNQ